jgi:hypothetical protein
VARIPEGYIGWMLGRKREAAELLDKIERVTGKRRGDMMLENKNVAAAGSALLAPSELMNGNLKFEGLR